MADPRRFSVQAAPADRGQPPGPLQGALDRAKCCIILVDRLRGELRAHDRLVGEGDLVLRVEVASAQCLVLCVISLKDLLKSFSCDTTVFSVRSAFATMTPAYTMPVPAYPMIPMIKMPSTMSSMRFRSTSFRP